MDSSIIANQFKKAGFGSDTAEDQNPQEDTDFISQENLKKNLKLFLFKSFINVNDQDLICGEQSIADILFEKQTNQEPDDQDGYEEAITQKPKCNEATEHLNAL